MLNFEATVLRSILDGTVIAARAPRVDLHLCRAVVTAADGERTSGLRIGELGEIESAAGERDRLGAGRDRAVTSEEAISEIVMVLTGVLTYGSKGR